MSSSCNRRIGRGSDIVSPNTTKPCLPLPLQWPSLYHQMGIVEQLSKKVHLTKLFIIIFLTFDSIPGPAITTGILHICEWSYISSIRACVRTRLLTHPVRKISNLVRILDFKSALHLSVLNRRRRPLGYVDVAKLKGEWTAGRANPVCFSLCLYHQTTIF